MRKIYKKLTEEQKNRGVIFTSTLSICTTELMGDTTHEVFLEDIDKNLVIKRLLDDKFFRDSYFKYNIIRK